MPADRTVMHVDMDAFFAAVEQHRKPELRGKPVVVGGRGDPTERGVVSTASYEARVYGIHSAMPLRTAFKRCPEAVFLPVDMPEYDRVSQVVRAILADLAPVVEVVGIDEAFVEMGGTDHPVQAALALKERIGAATGLTCSIGVAPNKLLAKIASDLEKPDGLTILTEDDLPSRVWPLPVRAVPWVGPKAADRLARLGIRTVGDLAAASGDLLVGEFGSGFGEYLARAARGIDDSPLVPRGARRSLGREVTFQADINEPAELQRRLDALARHVAAEAQREGYTGRTVHLKLRFSNFVTLTRQTALGADSDDPAAILEAARRALARIDVTRPVRLLGVRLTGLERSRERSPSTDPED